MGKTKAKDRSAKQAAKQAQGAADAEEASAATPAQTATVLGDRAVNSNAHQNGGEQRSDAPAKKQVRAVPAPAPTRAEAEPPVHQMAGLITKIEELRVESNAAKANEEKARAELKKERALRDEMEQQLQTSQAYLRASTVLATASLATSVFFGLALLRARS